MKRKINQKRYKIKTSSSEILGKHFYEIIGTDDLRYLLKLKSYDKLPEYDQELLLDAWDSIIAEHEEDTGTKSFTNNLISTNYGLKEKNRIEGLLLCVQLMLINPKLAKEKVNQFGLNVNIDNTNEVIKSIKKIENTVKSLDTKMRIKAIRDRDKGGYKNPYYDIVYILEDQLKGFTEEGLTLKKMDTLMKNIDIKNRKLKESHGG